MKRLPSLRPANPALLVSSLAMLVSLASLLVSVQQTSIARKQQAASVWPYLQMDYQSSNERGSKQIEVFVQNKGVGPARVRRIRLRYEGREYDEFYRLFKARYPEESFNHALSSLNGMVLSAGERKSLIMINDSLAAPEMYRIMQETDIKVAYSSVYDDLWLLDNDTVYAISNLREIR